MFNRSLTPDDLARFQQQRADADRAYNDALTALDDAIQRLRDMPHPPPGYDEHQITPLNERWDLLALKPPVPTGWRGRLRSLIWQTVAPLFERQQQFNAALVDHINRNVAMHRELTRALGSTIAVFREELEKLVLFESRLAQFAQQITPYVDTKDRDISGELSYVTTGLSGGLSGVSDELQKRWESMVAREQRYVHAVEDLRTSFGVVHDVTQMLKRELARLQTAEPSSLASDETPQTKVGGASADVFNRTLDSYKYVGFESQFRGSVETIRDRLRAYLPHFDGAADVVDIGCGRGEFLELLREHGVTARGIDTNHEMIEECRARNLDAEVADALVYLRGRPDGSVGGLFAAQVVEHLDPTYLLELLDVACAKLKPGACVILETINVASWAAFFNSYLRDLTHIRPLHPETLKYFVTASGFQDVRVVFSSPWPVGTALEPIPRVEQSGESADVTGLTQLVDTLNANIAKLNQLLFADQDYAVIARRR